MYSSLRWWLSRLACRWLAGLGAGSPPGDQLAATASQRRARASRCAWLVPPAEPAHNLAIAGPSTMCPDTHSRSPYSHQQCNYRSVAHEDPSSELKSFGLALRMLRGRASLSQEALAHICGLH